MPCVAVVGAGIAGASLARALDALGAEVTVFDSAGRGAGASGNPAALVTPAFDAGEGARAQLYAQAHRRAVGLLAAVDGAVIARGSVQMEATDRDAGRFDKIAASPLFTTLRRIEAGIEIKDALTVDPEPVLAAWAGDVRVGAIGRVDDLDSFDAVILACGADLPRLWPRSPLQSVRGQASWADGVFPETPIAFGGYAIPTRTGTLFGATHDKGDEDETVREEDHARNLALLAKGLPELAARLERLPLHGRARRRAATPDRMPLAGAVPGTANVYMLGGLGSRGFCTAPLLAEHVAALVVGGERTALLG